MQYQDVAIETASDRLLLQTGSTLVIHGERPRNLWPAKIYEYVE